MLLDIGQSLLNFLKAVSAFNYQFVSLILRGLYQTWQAAVTVGAAFVQACSQLIAYLLETSQELLAIWQAFVDMSHYLGQLVFKILIALYSGLECFSALLGRSLSMLVRMLSGCYVSVSQYIGISGNDVKLCISTGARNTNVFVRESVHSICQSLYYILVISLKLLAQLLLSCKQGLLQLCEVTTNNAKFALEQFFQSAKQICTFVTTQIPLEVWAWVLCILCAGFVLRCIVRYLSRRGMTVPLLSSFNGSGSEITIILDDSEVEVIESDVDSMDEVEDSGEEESVESSEEDEEEEDSSTAESSDASDSVEEYEVASDTEEEEVEDSDEENNQNRINVQLPERGGYGLRSRATPSLEEQDSSKSPDLHRFLAAERDRRACVVCQDAQKCVLVLPCRHMCLCVDCAHEIAGARMRNRRICPLCRAPIHTIMNVYM